MRVVRGPIAWRHELWGSPLRALATLLLAAQALGLSPVQQLRIVVLPQALRVIVPSLTN